MTNLSIRTMTLSGLALLAIWYALFGGRGIVATPVDFSENPVGWLIALASLVADVALLVVIRGVRRARSIAVQPEPLTPDDRMWSAHIAWLDECAVRRARKRGAKAS